MKTLRFLLPFAAVALVACGKSGGSDVAVQDSLSRDLSLAPVDTSAALSDAPAQAPPAVEPASPAPKPATATTSKPAPRAQSVTPPSSPAPSPPPAPTPAPAPARALESGTRLTLAAIDSFSTKTHKPGQTVTARVAADVKDDNGNTVIPAGATVTLSIVQLVVSENKADSGKVELRATRVTIGGESYDLDGTSSSVAYQLKGRGVTAGDAAKVGAGAVAGAVVGRVLSGKKKGAVVGGVVGAAAGTAAAINSADRDVVVAAGARIVITLKGAFSRT